MKLKFIASICFGSIWLLISLLFSILWAKEISVFFNYIYIWWVIIGIALIPGFLMSTMFFSNLLNIKHEKYPNTDENTTIIICAHNEEENITESILSIFNQKYLGKIFLIVVDNASDDFTKEKIINMKKYNNSNCSLKYVYCDRLGKFNALNYGLSLVNTKYFITVDADTYLEKSAVQMIMNHIVSSKSSCVAGNLFVKNTKKSLITRMQNYDYILSIASIKRFQGSYQSTLVAQGAFSAYHTESIKKIDGWKNCMGEDIVLTYQLLQLGMKSTYELRSVGYTNVPESFFAFYNQRKRWGIGMIEGLTLIPP